MTVDNLEVYADQSEEAFIINDTKLEVNPMDVSLFSDNAIYGASFLRSKAVFSYRSKHAREKVILTLPISVSVNDITNDGAAITSRTQGLKVLTQLCNYPFCFIKSNRIQSYVAPAGGISSSGFMIFGVEQITLVQDMSAPDILFVEFHLVFSNFTPLAKSFNFRTFNGTTVQYPSASDQFLDAFSEIGNNEADVKTFMTKLATYLNRTDVQEGVYYNMEVPYSSTVLLAPHMYNVEDESLREQPSGDFSGFLAEEVKEIQISASKGAATPSIAMLEGVANKEAHRKEENRETINIAWSAITDLSMLGQSALQSVRITRYNKIGRQFVSAHKHPVLQYMGKSPSRVELVYNTNTREAYSEDSESFVGVYTHVSNTLDYNAMMFPAANAYNHLKLQSIASIAMGVKNIVPNQRYITASSSKQGTENLTMTFIETDVEEFLKIGKAELGRERSVSSTLARNKVVETFLSTYDPNTSTLGLTKTDGEIVTAMANGMRAMAMEFSKGYTGSEFSDQSVWDATKDNINALVSSADFSVLGLATMAAQASSAVINKVSSILSSGYSSDIKTLSKAFNERAKYRDVYINEGKEVASQKLSNIQLQLIVKTGDGTSNKTVSAGNASNFVRNGAVDIQISRIFTAIGVLADRGDARAKSALNKLGTTAEALNDATISSYIGTNYPDINLKGIQDSQGVSPMYFIKEESHLKSSDLATANVLVADSFKESVDTLLTDVEQLDEIGVKFDTSVREAVFVPEDEIDERSYMAENNSGYWTNILGELVSASSSLIGNPTQSSFMNATSGSGGYTDWNAIQGDSTQQRAKEVIRKEVANSSLIAASAKQDWTYFLINVAGVESGLGKNLASGTGAVGLFQIVGSTAESLGFSRSSVGSDFSAATKAAIKYMSKIQSTCKKNGFNNWVDMFICYNLGETGGTGALKTHYRGAELTSAARSGIRTQRIPNLNADGNGKTVASTYYGVISAKFGSLYKYLSQGSSASVTTSSSNGVKKESTGTVTLTRSDIASDYMKAIYVDDDNKNTGSFFNALYNSRVIRVNIKGIVVPVPPIEREIKILGGKTIKYTEKGQKYGKDAREYLKKILKSGFYIEKTTSSSVSTAVFDMNYGNIATKLLNQGLAIPVVNSGYTLKNASTAPNFAGQKDRIEPSLYSANMNAYRNQVKAGTKPLSDIVEPGTTPTYVDGTPYSQNKDTSTSASNKSVTYKPSSTTNTYLPFQGGGGTITSEYGKLRTKANGVKREGYHFGIDCKPTKGSNNIVAAAKGKVVEAGWAGSAGLRVRIWHSTIGFSTQYFHLKSISVKQGQTVSVGQVIGVMGGSGSDGQTSYPVHCHYQVGFGNASSGNLVNPFKTTILAAIPDYTGSEGSQGLKRHAETFLDPKYYQNYRGDDLSKTNKVYTGKGEFFASSGGAPDGDNSSESVTMKPTLSEGESRGIDNEYSVYNKEIIRAKQLESMMYPFEQGFNTCFPVIKAYVTVGSDNEDLLLRDSIRLGYYFEIEGINTAKVACNNDDNPVDLLLMTIANPSFAMTDDYSVTGKYLTTNMDTLYGPEEVSWLADRIKLKPGNKLHIRAGYGNDPNKLHTIFNGIITEMTHDKSVLLNLVCEGFGRELLATQIEPAAPSAAGGEWHNSSTGVVISQSLLQDGIIHFGTTTNNLQFVSSWFSLLSSSVPDSDDKTDPEAKRLITRVGGSVFDGNTGLGVHFSKGNLKQRLFTNIYAAEIDVLQPQFSSKLSNYLSGLFSLTEKAGYFYIFEGQTPWEACKEMEYRHPGTLVKPLFYDDRMTLFFGLKEQMYIARDLDSEYMASVSRSGEEDGVVSTNYLKQRHKRMELVTKMHVATSSTNIVTNGLTLNSSFCTGVNVLFFEDDTERKEADKEEYEEFKMTVDDNLNFWEYRYKTISMPGTHGKYSSFMYGTTALRREAETMYKGKIVLLGNPQIKAGDFIYIDDEINKMQGLLKVRECLHTYNEQGYVTEITPSLYVESSNFFHTSLLLELGLTAQIATTLASIGVQDSAFNSQSFNAYLNVFQNYKHLTESTNIDKVNNGVAYNTGGGILPLSALTLNGILGYSAYRSTQLVGLNAELLKKIGGLGLKGMRNVATGLSFAGSTAYNAYQMSKGAQAATSSGRFASVANQFSKVAKGLNATTKVAAASKIMKAFRSVSLIMMTRLAANPFALVAMIIGTVAFAYVEGLIQESTLTRQPLMFFPINYVGRPYTAGISGYKYNSWWESKKENLSRTSDNVTKGLTEISVTKPDSFVSSILGWMNGNSTSKVADSIQTVEQEQSLRK